MFPLLHRCGIVFVLLILFGLQADERRSAQAGPRSSLAVSPAEPAQTTVVISDTVRLAGAKRLGINLGGHSQWGADIILKNLVINPGFEAGHFGMIFLTLPGATATRLQADFWETAWNNDQYGIGQPVGFWDGAEYEIVSGPARGRTGTVASFTHDDERYTFHLDSPGPAPNTGDAVMLRKAFPGYLRDYQPFNQADTATTRPGSPGLQSLELLPPDEAWQSAWWYGMDSYWRDSDRTAGKLLLVDGAWRFEVWARADNPGEHLTVRFYREGLPPFLDETIPLSTTWQPIVREFTVPPGGDPYGLSDPDPNAFHGILLLALQRDTDGGRVWVDDISLARADHTNPTVFTDNFVERLQELRPGVVRDWGLGQLGSTLDSQLAPAWGRGSNSFTPAVRIPDDFHYSLHDFLALAAYLDAEPWYMIPPTFSAAEMTNLMAYLAAPAGSHPYADRRAALGQNAPWTELFDLIHLEFGNEAWGANGFGDPFIGATFRGGERLGQVAGERLGMLRASPYFVPERFNLIIGSQASVPWRSHEIEVNSSSHDSIALAPYFGILEEWGSDEEIWGPVFARAVQDTRPNGWVGEAQAHMNALASDTRLSIYEVNFHTTDGSAPLEIRNAYVTGQPAALAGLALLYAALSARLGHPGSGCLLRPSVFLSDEQWRVCAAVGNVAGFGSNTTQAPCLAGAGTDQSGHPGQSAGDGGQRKPCVGAAAPQRRDASHRSSLYSRLRLAGRQ